VAAFVAVMVLAWLSHLPLKSMAGSGVSAAVLSQGGYKNIALHMSAHGSVFHLLMNSPALLEIGGLVVVVRLGGSPQGWLRVLLAFGVAGLSSMIFFLSFHPQASCR
jgi:hypothetical protein